MTGKLMATAAAAATAGRGVLLQGSSAAMLLAESCQQAPMTAALSAIADGSQLRRSAVFAIQMKCLNSKDNQVPFR